MTTDLEKQYITALEEYKVLADKQITQLNKIINVLEIKYENLRPITK